MSSNSRLTNQQIFQQIALLDAEIRRKEKIHREKREKFLAQEGDLVQRVKKLRKQKRMSPDEIQSYYKLHWNRIAVALHWGYKNNSFRGEVIKRRAYCAELNRRANILAALDAIIQGKQARNQIVLNIVDLTITHAQPSKPVTLLDVVQSKIDHERHLIEGVQRRIAAAPDQPTIITPEETAAIESHQRIRDKTADYLAQLDRKLQANVQQAATTRHQLTAQTKPLKLAGAKQNV